MTDETWGPRGPLDTNERAPRGYHKKSPLFEVGLFCLDSGIFHHHLMTVIFRVKT